MVHTDRKCQDWQTSNRQTLEKVAEPLTSRVRTVLSSGLLAVQWRAVLPSMSVTTMSAPCSVRVCSTTIVLLYIVP